MRLASRKLISGNSARKAGSTCFAQQDELALDGADGLFLLPELLQIMAL
jgi:hypothetical protein